MGLKRVCSASGRLWPWYRSHGVTKLSLAIPRGSVDHTHRRSTLYVDIPRGARGPLRMHSRFLKANEEATAFVWTVYKVADRPRGGIQKVGTGTRPMAWSTCAPTTWPRSVRRVRLRLGRDRPAISTSIDCAEQLFAPLLIVFQSCMYFDPEIDPCPTLQGQ